jgi:hypothetical protein
MSSYFNPPFLWALPQRMGVREHYFIPREELVLEVRPFASGGGGQVYRGTYNGTVVAAKSVFSQAMTTQLEEFNREVKMLAHLAHPNIVTVCPPLPLQFRAHVRSMRRTCKFEF